MMSRWRYLTGAAGPSGYGSKTTAAQVAHDHAEAIRGKVVLVTGAASGIGFEAARAFAEQGAIVYVTARTDKQAEEAADRIRQQHPNATVKTLALDLSSVASIKKSAETFNANGDPLHILLNNAGVMATPKQLTKDGFELQFGTNHVGHFYLTELLLPKLKASAPSRVVTVSSTLHSLAPPEGIAFDDLDASKSYEKMQRYGHSKLANILFTRELQARMTKENTGVTAYSLHPGLIPTNLTRSVLGMTATKIIYFFMATKNIPQGAATSVFAAVSHKAVPGEFHDDCNVDLKGHHRHFRDLDVAARLWTVSEELVAGALARTA